jgi:hypothetical protein
MYSIVDYDSLSFLGIRTGGCSFVDISSVSYDPIAPHAWITAVRAPRLTCCASCGGGAWDPLKFADAVVGAAEEGAGGP